MFIGLFLLFEFAVGSVPNPVAKEYLKAGGSQKALSHLNCFLDQHQHTRFRLKKVNSLEKRCNEIEAGSALVSINKPRFAVIVDYTLSSNRRRFFILDLSGKAGSSLKSYFTSHGRYLNTSHRNTTPGKNKNTIRRMKYFGNVKGSNATSTGFFITGSRYQGRWVGPAGDKYSLIVHGLEKQTNDNACERAVVIHGNSHISESGPSKGVNSMSSGCYMLDYNHVNEVVEQLRGMGDESDPSVYNGGVVLFTHGPREAKMNSKFYCDGPQKDIFNID